MKRIRILYLSAVAAALFFALPAYSKPAKRDLHTVVQPDGTTLRLRLSGDERMHFIISEEGYLLIQDDDGFYRLGALASDGAIVSTGVLPYAPDAALVAQPYQTLNAEFLALKRNSRRRAQQYSYGLSSTTYPRTGSPKGLIILVEYQDVKFNSSYDAVGYFNDMINGKNFTQYRGTGSALQYFTEQSGGIFTPEFDVLGPVTLPKPQSYYGQNDRFGEDMNAHLMITDAIDILDSTVDFSVYDTDKNGEIDNVYVFYAGQGEADYGGRNTVWPHSWDLASAGLNKRVDGVKVNHYACSNEWADTEPDGVGTFIHEFSHVMGLPDLYHTSQDADYTPDAYSVLDYGPYNNDGRTPPNYGAYERNAMGWYEPILLNRPLSVSLDEISSGKFGLIPTEKDTEFFLLENRQQTGWDAYIPGHGLLIWHIDYVAKIFEDNVVNNTQNHQYVDIVEANGVANYKYSDQYTFPGTTGKTSFTSSTSPALKSWSGKAIDLPVTDIAETNGIITFNVAGGEKSTSIDEVSPDTVNPQYYNLLGQPLANPEPGTIVIEKRGLQVKKIII